MAVADFTAVHLALALDNERALRSGEAAWMTRLVSAARRTRSTAERSAVRSALRSPRARRSSGHGGRCPRGGPAHARGACLAGRPDRPVYQVGGKSFVFFRAPRPDAVDPETGERYDDVIVLWVPSEADKLALVQDGGSPFFTTPHFDGHQSVLVRAGRLGEVSRAELTEIVEDAWLSRASPTRVRAWLRERETDPVDGG